MTPELSWAYFGPGRFNHTLASHLISCGGFLHFGKDSHDVHLHNTLIHIYLHSGVRQIPQPPAILRSRLHVAFTYHHLSQGNSFLWQDGLSWINRRGFLNQHIKYKLQAVTQHSLPHFQRPMCRWLCESIGILMTFICLPNNSIVDFLSLTHLSYAIQMPRPVEFCFTQHISIPNGS